VPDAVAVTVTDAEAIPPAPVHERLKVDVAGKGPVDSDPPVARLPLHAPDAVQPVALVDDHVSVADPPTVTDVGLAVSDTVGGGGGAAVTVTVVDALALPPGPEQVSA